MCLGQWIPNGGQKPNLTHEEIYNENWAVWIPPEIMCPWKLDFSVQYMGLVTKRNSVSQLTEWEYIPGDVNSLYITLLDVNVKMYIL